MTLGPTIIPTTVYQNQMKMFFNKNKQEDIELNYFPEVNKLIMKSANTQLAPLPQHPPSIQGNQINVSYLDTFHRKFTFTPKRMYHGQ